MMETVFYIVLLLIGLALVVFRPLARLTKISIYWEIGAGALLVILFLFHLTSNYVTPISEEDLAKKPCGTESPQGACYSLEHSLCQKAWDNAEMGCKAEVAELLAHRPSAITGPTMNRCKAKKMDQFLRYNRAQTNTPFCRAYFDYIEAR